MTFNFQCYNGGSCEVLDNGKPFCECIMGYWGDNCEQSEYNMILRSEIIAKSLLKMQ